MIDTYGDCPSCGPPRRWPTPSPRRSRRSTATRDAVTAGSAATTRCGSRPQGAGHEVALEITTRIFEVTGARSTATVGLDRFFRNVRTHTLHDPVAYKRREVGRNLLIGELPEPTWYS